jgi:hypothetical protein
MPVGADEMAHLERPPQDELPGSGASIGLRLAAKLLRAAFICIVLLIVLRVSMPQNETIWTAYDTPGDLVRLALGLAVCVWLAVQLFRGPKDADGFRTWIYLGLAAVPFALACLAAVWWSFLAHS